MVVVIMGILAAIAVPMYLNQRDSAYRAAVTGAAFCLDGAPEEVALDDAADPTASLSGGRGRATVRSSN